ncbi:relaxase/mobilization nuclease domain-containing protein [Falsiroseomonas tokyonensis]|uniref:Relaxase/mobilization nuclease domain-containing protein n=1 Tax=Falsiroseomonas tokyonensis TaxID=430521 RepID=A0ABV7C1K6_9PROT|nr:relaxase/mobilization nuclease domain-containing protein [Falsiroseomonas tokyonensis]MBU8541744.1 relaxase/mobilization nuclease domain-containing protein [Falsiroseomonas tokyonensis]
MPRNGEDPWRLAERRSGTDTPLTTGHRPSLSPDAKARLARIVRRAPEVMVKITGRSRGIVHLKSHFDYLTRNGRLEAETQDGQPVSDRAALRALHEDWLMANALMERDRGVRVGPEKAQSVGIILSMPVGAPPDRVQDAARAWARETFGNRHDWLMVRHDDRDHPHVHVTVRAVGSDGRRLVAGPADLQAWRERFATELRRLGVVAEATPRHARGLVAKAERTVVREVRLRGLEPRAVREERRRAAGDAAAPLREPQGWEKAIQQRQASIRAAYLTNAEILDAGDETDRRLAADIRTFVAGMPVPLNRRQALAAELRRGRDAPTATPLLPPEPAIPTLGQGSLPTPVPEPNPLRRRK